jgi:hypothetical protein
MKQLSGPRARRRIARALAIAAAVLGATALSQPNLAYAGPHGGGGGFHGGGGGFHGGGGGFHGGGGGFHGGGFGGFHGHFAGMHNGFGERHEGFGDRREDFRERHEGFRRGVGFGFFGYPYGWDYSPDYGYYDYSQPSQIWYYCSDPAGYYPYVTQCNTGWQTVPAS